MKGQALMTRIGVVWDALGWHEKFCHALEMKRREGTQVEWDTLSFDSPEWARSAEQCDLILWMPGYNGPQIAAEFKEKIYFLQEHLGKVVVPNFQTVWHYESKIAQSFLFSKYGVPTPRTLVCSSYDSACEEIEKGTFPLVFKKSHGASSDNVWRVRTKSSALRAISAIFSQQLWDRAKQSKHSPFAAAATSLHHRWFWEKVLQKLLGRERYGVVYWQEFIPDNDADLRVTFFGDRYAVCFWRKNRPHDFRASGSGRIDYDRPIPEDAIRLCSRISQQLDFDSMAYDLLYHNGSPVVTEMSYSFVDTAVFNAPGHYELDDRAGIRFVPGHTWPQEFWVRWALHRHACRSQKGKGKPE